MSFERFLEIGKLLNLDIRVVADNDENVEALENKYKDYLDGKVKNIKICYDDDEEYPTLEPQLLKANSLEALNTVLNKSFKNDAELLSYMGKNKTDCALKVFNSDEELRFPEYIKNAIKK